jgi:hypothetical protein
MPKPMNDRIRELGYKSGFGPAWTDDTYKGLPNQNYYILRNFAHGIIYDILNEITNDDSLGEARIETIRRIAERYGVAR